MLGLSFGNEFTFKSAINVVSIHVFKKSLLAATTRLCTLIHLLGIPTDEPPVIKVRSQKQSSSLSLKKDSRSCCCFAGCWMCIIRICMSEHWPTENWQEMKITKPIANEFKY